MMQKSVQTTADLRRIRATRAGASLVEVLVIIVILLVGIFSLIRVFPVGFGVLQQGENRTLAQRLATQTMEQLKAEDANLPDGVLFGVLEGAGNQQRWRFITGVDPDDLGAYTPTGADVAAVNPYFDGVNKFRYIDGEQVAIPLPTAGRFGAGSLHMVKFGPLFMHPDAGDPNTAFTTDADIAFANNFLNVAGAPLRGIPTSSAGTANPVRRLRGENTYLIDYGTEYSPAQIMFLPRPVPTTPRARPYRLFRVSFAYAVTDTDEDDPETGDVEGGVVVVRVDDSDTAVWQPIADTGGGGPDFGNILAGSDVVSRSFDRLPLTAAWDSRDPYQYKLLSSNIESESGGTSFANMGVLAFNPAGANYSERTAFGQRPFAASVSYAVLDWQILRENREVPSVFFDQGAGIPIKLTMNFIKRVGDVEADRTIYRGLYRDARFANDLQASIQVFDLQGRLDDPTLLGEPLAVGLPGDNNADYWVNPDERAGSFRTGTIYINPDGPRRVGAGSQLRILYKADGDWSVSLQKAYSRYQPERVVDADRPTGHNSFARQGLQANNARLVFNRSELNKSVVATLQYTDQNDRVVRTAPVQMTIDTVDPGDPTLVYANVSRFMPNRKEGEHWHAYGNVLGASLKVRVTWRDNMTPSNPWRIQDLDTYVRRSNGR